MSRIQAALGFGLSILLRWTVMEKKEPYLVAFTGSSPLGHLWNKWVPSLLMAQKPALSPPSGPGQLVPSCPGRWLADGTSSGHGYGSHLGLLPPVCFSDLSFASRPKYVAGSCPHWSPPTLALACWHAGFGCRGSQWQEASGPWEHGTEICTRLPSSFFLGCITYLVSFMFYFISR